MFSKFKLLPVVVLKYVVLEVDLDPQDGLQHFYNYEIRILLEKLANKHMHCPYSCPTPKMNASIIQKIIFLSTPTYFEMTLSTMRTR